MRQKRVLIDQAEVLKGMNADSVHELDLGMALTELNAMANHIEKMMQAVLLAITYRVNKQKATKRKGKK